MSPFQCEEADSEAPRVGCRCRKCYRARELSLDPRLLALARHDRMAITMQPSKAILHRVLTHYLMGQLDHGALYLTITTAIAEALDKQFEQSLVLASRQPMVFSDKPWPPNLDKAPGDGT